MNKVEDAYAELARSVLDFVKNRPWDEGVCKCAIFNKMASSSWWLTIGTNLVKDGLDWPNKSIDSGGAALFLRDSLLKATGDRIWGLTFTLYPGGKFKLAYDYAKPADYENTDEFAG
jgi:hypothetical protein